MLATLILLALLHFSSGCNPACTFSRCRNGPAFKPRLIKDQSSPFLLRAQEKRWHPYICRRETTYPLRISSIKTGEARVRRMADAAARFTRISRYRPEGMKTAFPRRYFHLQKFRKGEWVIVRGRTKGKQENFLDDLCVTLPVSEYRYLSSSGRPRGRKKKGKKGDCISFRTRTVKMLVELRWDSVDDLDLSVEEPDGRIASRFGKDSCGKLAGDVGSRLGVCINVPDKSESIRYFECVPKGKYIIRVGHYRNCGGRTKYEVRVTRFGKLIFSKLGVSDQKSRSVIDEIEVDL